MSDSQFLYQLMLRVNESRAKHPTVKPYQITAALSVAQCAIDTNDSMDNVRECLLEVAATSLRLAVEMPNGDRKA